MLPATGPAFRVSEFPAVDNGELLSVRGVGIPEAVLAAEHLEAELLEELPATRVAFADVGVDGSGDFKLQEFAGAYRGNRRLNQLRRGLNTTQVVGRKLQNRNVTTGKVLLVTNVLI